LIGWRANDSEIFCIEGMNDLVCMFLSPGCSILMTNSSNEGKNNIEVLDEYKVRPNEFMEISMMKKISGVYRIS
jgi:hypothetical protein